ncbi:MAG: calcium/proton exchanger [Clostridiales Family XIII bacterium]|jgi:Ca2+:H+ antiporter|nr:calcium/proton exchanger [Clostridiales Family XIII bacterium]
MKLLYWLLLCIPVALLAHFVFRLDDGIVFVFTCLGIVPLAAVLGDATEQISYYVGPKVGGFLNATMGNVPELLICGFAIKAGMHSLVLASLAGSIFGNILLVTGMSVLCGGLKYKFLTYNTNITHTNFSLLAFALFAVSVPFFFKFAHGGAVSDIVINDFSLILAIIMVVLYVLGLVFSLITHRDIFVLESEDEEDEEGPDWSLKKGVVVMLAATAVVAVMSELLVETVEGAAEKFGLNEAFVGIILIPILGNVAEHASAIIMAIRGKLDISIEIAVGSSMQIAIFVTPLMIIFSAFTGDIMGYLYTPMELLGLWLSIGLSYVLFLDKKANWLEGAIHIVAYLILAAGFLMFGI